jgi:predicted transcriptional regulator
MSGSSRVNARLDPELARKVAAVRRRTRKSLTEIVKESLAAYCEVQLKRQAPLLETLEAAGFVGCAVGPRDLSMKYKEELSASLGRKS